MKAILWLIEIVLLFVIFVIVVFYLILRRSGDDDDMPTGGGVSGDLYERYLKGEITVDQYQEMRKELLEHTPENIAEKFSRFF